MITARLAPARSVGAVGLASLVSVMSVAFAALGAYLLYLNGSFAALVDDSAGIDMAVAISFPAVGAIVASRCPENSIGWIFCAVGLFQGMAVFADQYASYALVTAPGTLPAGVMMGWLGTWTWVPGVGLTSMFLLLLFPHGRLPSRRWEPVAWTAAIGIVLGVVALAIAPWDVLEMYPPFANPLGFENSGTFTVVLGITALVLWAVGSVLSLGALVLRLRGARGEERQQLKWFVYAGALAIGLILLALIPPLYNLSAFLQIAAVPLLPAAAGVAILRYQLFDIDLIINRTLVYGVLTACVIAVYVVVVGYLGELFRADDNLPISLLATGTVAVLFAPLRERLQRGVNRLMYGDRDDPYAVLAGLGQRLEATLVPDAVLPAIVNTVKDALRLSYAAITLTDHDAPIAVVGEPAGTPLRLPLSYQNEAVGELWLGTRTGDSGFSPADRRLLEDLARQVGVVTHAVRLTSDLQRARARLVTAREEERRRLRRDLHDGLGPQLSSQALTIDAVRAVMRKNPDVAEELLLDLKSQSQDAVADIRRLVYELRPPALDDLGLLGALRESAARYSQHGLDMRVVAPEPLQVPSAAVEVALYRIAREAMTNVLRHAGARTCTIALEIEPSASIVRLDVCDDGCGISMNEHSDTNIRAGIGLASMRERATELGGKLTVDSPPEGGTRVRVALPLAVETQL